MLQRPELVKMLFSVPLDVRQWLEERAAADLAPMNSVAIVALRKVMEAERRDRAT